MWRMLSHNNLNRIVGTFREAIDLDPLNPDSYAGLSHALIAQALYGNLGLTRAYGSARVVAATALTLHSDSEEAHCAIAWLRMLCDRDWEGAEEAFDSLLNRHPTNMRIVIGRALSHIVRGHLNQSSGLLSAASESSALNSLSLGLHCWNLYLIRDYSRVMEGVSAAYANGGSSPIIAAIEALTSLQTEHLPSAMSRIERLLDQDSGHELVRGAMGYAAGRAGNHETARAILQHLMDRREDTRLPPHFAIALVHLGLDQKEEAMDSILLSYEDGSLWSLGFHMDPILSSLEGDAAFRTFIRNCYPTSPDRSGLRN
jgi:hypothetical protein